MLKPNATEEQLRFASESSRKLAAIAFFISYASIFVLYDLRHGTIPTMDSGDFLFFIPIIYVSNLLAEYLWWPAAAWVGRFDLFGTIDTLKSANPNQKIVSRFLEAWADNEFALDTLRVLSRVVFFDFLYLAFGPLVGVL
jgi:hypothetical protein